MGKFIHDIASLTLNGRYDDENAATFQRNFEMHSSVLHFVKYLHAGGRGRRRGRRRGWREADTYSIKAEAGKVGYIQTSFKRSSIWVASNLNFLAKS